MIFDNLADKCNHYRNMTDYRLVPNLPILVMIDGKNFSSLIKNKFEKPFDEWFINTMNKTAEHLCKNIQNCVGAFVQSDEISLLIKDNSLTCAPFDGRLCKLHSIIPAMATAFFNREMVKRELTKPSLDPSATGLMGYLDTMPDYVFDCKVWNVPNYNDAMAWFIYRQNDCLRNSKQQFAQTYVPHKTLLNKDTDEQVRICLEQSGNDWNLISDDKKMGRLLYKSPVTFTNPDGVEYTRNKWLITAGSLNDTKFRTNILNEWLKDNKEK